MRRSKIAKRNVRAKKSARQSPNRSNSGDCSLAAARFLDINTLVIQGTSGNDTLSLSDVDAKGNIIATVNDVVVGTAKASAKPSTPSESSSAASAATTPSSAARATNASKAATAMTLAHGQRRR